VSEAFWNGKRVFVSGGAGVIGRPLVERLRRSGACLLVGDLRKRPEDWPEDVAYREGDLNEMTMREFEQFAPQVVFHLAAAFERTEETAAFWEENERHNVRLSGHLLSLASGAASLERIVFASSYLVYDPSLYLFESPPTGARALSEADRVLPRNLCGASKAFCEAQLRFWRERWAKAGPKQGAGRPTAVSARIFRVYGCGSRDVVSRWIRAALRGETLSVYRKEGMFDYIFADDVAEGLIRLAESGVEGEVNLGTGYARRVADVLDVLREMVPGVRWEEADVGGPYEASCADMRLFERWTGWRPSVSLEEGMRRVAEYERRFLAGNGRTASCAYPSSDNWAVLVTSASRKIPLVRSLRAALRELSTEAKGGETLPIGRVIAADCHPGCPARFEADGFWAMPRLERLTIDEFEAYCRENGVRAVIPTRDGELPFFAKYRNRLAAAGIAVMVSPPEAVALCRDKLMFYERLGDEFPIIPTALSAEKVSVPDGTFVVKERFGAGGRHARIGVTREEAERAACGMESPIFQPCVKGVEYSVDLYVNASGRAIGAVARIREYVADGEALVTRSVRHERLEALCLRLAERIGLYGHAVVQAIETSDGSLHILECNPRFGGASTLAEACGLRSFLWFLTEAFVGKAVDPDVFVRSDKQWRQVRVAIDRWETV